MSYRKTTTSPGLHAPSPKITSRHVPPHEKLEPGADSIRDVFPSTRTTKVETDLTNRLNALFSMYNEKAATEDRNTAESWKSDADGALLATSLFSVMVAIFLGISYHDLQLFSQDPSGFCPAQIYQLSTLEAGSLVRLRSTSSNSLAFSPATSSVWVNGLWSLSLVVNLSCVLFASLLQQWARRFLRITQGIHDPQKRVRIREMMVQGVEKYRLPSVASALPALFHFSISLFLVGHVILLSNFNHAVFVAVFTCVGTCAVLYLCFTLSPILRYDSPYHTPLSPLVWFYMAGVPWLTLNLIYRATEKLDFISFRARLRILDVARVFHRHMFIGTIKEVEDVAQTRALELDTPAISRTFDSLDGIQDMVQFLDNIPAFYGSTEVERDAQVLEHLNSIQLPGAIATFMDQSWSSDLLTDPEKKARIAICLKALNAHPLLLQCTFRRTLQSMRSSVFECADFVLGAESHSDDSDPWTRHYARCIIAVAINRVQEFNKNWSNIIIRHRLGSLQLPRDKYFSRGDSVKFINFICIARDLSDSHLNSSDQFEPGKIWHNVLSETRKFEAMDTAPEFQGLFCALWNDLVDVTQDPQGFLMARTNAIHILSLIRTIFLPLHQGTTSAPVAYSTSTNDHDPVLRDQTSYTRCDVESHRLPTLVVSIPPNDTEKIPLLDTLPSPILVALDDTEPDLGLTPGVSRLPAEDDADADPGPLTLAMRKSLSDDTRVRILVVGKAGSGKSSLINSIFRASTPAASHKEFGHDIETEHCPDDNPQLIFHESPGFRSGDETSLQIIQDFVTERTGAKRPESRRLDAIWICVSIPDATQGRLEGGVEKVLRLGKVPVVVVFTKFDEITYTAECDPNASDADNSQLRQLALDAAHEQYRMLCRTLFDKDPGDLPAVNVSVEQEHRNLIKQLVKTTDKNITELRMAPSPVEWSIEQTGSHDLEIDASIELGGEKYWRILWSLIDFKGQRLQDCLRILHTHIVGLWNFPDRSQYLSSDEFKGKMSHMVEDLACLLVAPSSSMSNIHQTTQRNIPCVMGYMIDLTVILHELSKSIGNVSPRNVRFAMAEHVISGRETRIHRAIRSFIVETSTAKIIQEDAVIEMVVGLTKEFLVPTDS